MTLYFKKYIAIFCPKKNFFLFSNGYIPFKHPQQPVAVLPSFITGDLLQSVKPLLEQLAQNILSVFAIGRGRAPEGQASGGKVGRLQNAVRGHFQGKGCRVS